MSTNNTITNNTINLSINFLHLLVQYTLHHSPNIDNLAQPLNPTLIPTPSTSTVVPAPSTSSASPWPVFPLGLPEPSLALALPPVLLLEGELADADALLGEDLLVAVQQLVQGLVLLVHGLEGEVDHLGHLAPVAAVLAYGTGTCSRLDTISQ